MTQRWQGAAIVVAGVAALLAAWLIYGDRGYHTPHDAGVVPSTAQAPLVAARTNSALASSAATAARAGTPPLRVVIASISVDAPVVPVSVHDGTLDVPSDPQSLGWWAAGARAGSTTGSVVVVGHVDAWNSGAGALYHLESVPLGAQVMVQTAAGAATYQVVGRRVYPKQALPSSVFATGGAPRLVLITCGGPFDRTTRHYADNVVAYAVPVTA